MKKRVCFLCSEKGFGVKTREVVTLANSLVGLYDVEIVFLSDLNKQVDLNNKIRVTIYSMKMFGNNKFFKKFLRDVDVVIVTDSIFNRYIHKGSCKSIFWTHEVMDDNFDNIVAYSMVVVPNKELFSVYNVYHDNVVIINDALEISDRVSDLKTNNIVYIGNLTKDKRVEELIKVVNDVNKKIDINLHIVGCGDEKNNLEQFVSNKGIKNVKFWGEVTKSKLGDILSSSSLYVSTSKNPYGSFSALLAMNYGIPIIAYEEAFSLATLIMDDINGYVIKDHNVEFLKNKIIDVMRDYDKRIELGTCSKEKVLEFDINSIKIEWLKII